MLELHSVGHDGRAIVYVAPEHISDIVAWEEKHHTSDSKTLVSESRVTLTNGKCFCVEQSAKEVKVMRDKALKK